jgi:hypothetical protein
VDRIFDAAKRATRTMTDDEIRALCGPVAARRGMQQF